jgi:hypothetical protein
MRDFILGSRDLAGKQREQLPTPLSMLVKKRYERVADFPCFLVMADVPHDVADFHEMVVV